MSPKTNAPAFGRGAVVQSVPVRSAAVAEEAQHEQEQVDEVEVERERTHHRLAGRDRAVLVHVIHLLDLLGVPGGQAGEDEDAEHGDDEAERARADAERRQDDLGKHSQNEAAEMKNTCVIEVPVYCTKMADSAAPSSAA